MAGMNLNISKEDIDYNTNINEIYVPEHMRQRIPFNMKFVDDLFGGSGVIPTMSVLFTGTPGAGKTTLLLQLATQVHSSGNVGLYISREEALSQIKMTSERLNLSGFIVGDAELVSTEDLDSNTLRIWEKHWSKPGRRKRTIIEHAQYQIDHNPGKQLFMFLDSLPTFNDGKYGPGNINGKTSLRVVEQLVSFCQQGYKDTYPILVIIGHVVKNGTFAGLNTIKHAVDAHMHLFIEEDKKSDLWGERIIEVQKNRFGCNDKKMILGMDTSGLYKKGEFSWV